MPVFKKIRKDAYGHEEHETFDINGNITHHSNFFGTRKYIYNEKGLVEKITLNKSSNDDPNIFETYVTKIEYIDNTIRETTCKINSLNVDNLNYNLQAKIPTKGDVHNEIISVCEKKTNLHGIESEKYTDITNNISTIKEYVYDSNGNILNEKEYRFTHNTKYLALETYNNFDSQTGLNTINKYGLFGNEFVLYETRKTIANTRDTYIDVYQEGIDCKFLDGTLKVGFSDLENLKKNRIINKFLEKIPNEILLSSPKKTVKDFDKFGNVTSLKIVDSNNEAKYYKRQFYYNDYDENYNLILVARFDFNLFNDTIEFSDSLKYIYY